MRIELTTSPWQREILPLNYIHIYKQIIANLPSARATHLISPQRIRHSAITVQYGGEYGNRTRLSGVTSQYSSR